MGTTASREVKGATPEQLETVGKFQLRSSQSAATKALYERILNQLLAENNIFDLAAVLGDKRSCDSMFIVLSDMVKKEFALTRFPDPKSPSELRSTFFKPKKSYDKLGSSTALKNMCEDITFFMLRMVTFIAAMTASIYDSTQMEQLTRTREEMEKKQTLKYIKGSSKLTLENRPAVDEEFALYSKELIVNNSDAFVSLKSYYNSTDPKYDNLYFFQEKPLNPSSGESQALVHTSIVYNVKYGLIYRPFDEKETPVLKFSISKVTVEPQGYSSRQSAPYGFGTAPASGFGQAPAAPPAPAPPAPVPGAPGSTSSGFNPFGTSTSGKTNASSASSVLSGGARRTRHFRSHHARYTRRKQRGGQVQKFVIELTHVDCSKFSSAGTAGPFGGLSRGVCSTKYTLEDNKGNIRLGSSVGFPSSGAPSLTNLHKVVKDELAKDGVYIEPLFEIAKAKPSTISKEMGEQSAFFKGLKDITTSFKTTDEGTSPSMYRAFLLATRQDSSAGRLYSFFCNDAWRPRGEEKKMFTDVIAYALLQALYYNAKGRQTEATTELVKHAKAFLTTDTATSNGEVASFGDLGFKQLPSGLAGRCKKSAIEYAKNTYETEIVDPVAAKTLRDAHKELRGLYDAHLGAVIELVRKALTLEFTDGVTADGKRETTIVLNPTFHKHPSGSLAAMEEIIQEGRTLLANHYLKVEIVYNKALASISGPSVGATNVVKGNILEKLNRET